MAHAKLERMHGVQHSKAASKIRKPHDDACTGVLPCMLQRPCPSLISREVVVIDTVTCVIGQLENRTQLISSGYTPCCNSFVRYQPIFAHIRLYFL